MPQLFIKDEMDEPEQVLVIGFDKDINIETLITEVSSKFNQSLQDGPDLLIIPVHIQDSFFNSVRETKCKIYNPYNLQPKKKWWKAW